MFLPTKNALKRALMFSIAGSRGGIVRLKILVVLAKRPLNINEISKKFLLDYKTAQHHIRVLERSSLIVSPGKKYDNRYQLSTLLKSNENILMGIWEKVNKEMKREYNHDRNDFHGIACG